MRPELTFILTIFGSVMASSGFWAWMQKKNEAKDARTQLLLGMAHNSIIAQGSLYILRGSITTDEYEDFMKYLYLPYKRFGGNGLAERVVKEVENLPMIVTKERHGSEQQDL